MDAKTFYRSIFVGNESYKSRREELDYVKRQVHKLGGKLQEDDYLNILMSMDLAQYMLYYVRKFISGAFQILIFKSLKSKLELKNPISRNFSQLKFKIPLTNMTFELYFQPG